MIRAVVADDERLALDELKHLLGKMEGIEVVGEAKDGNSAWDIVSEQKPDLLFLDIHMPGLSGIELARGLSMMETPPRIIFVTAYDQYAVEAFETEALDYLLKPVEPERLASAVDRARRAIEKHEPPITATLEEILEKLSKTKKSARRVAVKKGTKVHLVEPAKIIYLAVEEGVVRAVGVEVSGSLPYRSLDDAEKDLPDNFFRANRANLVNIDQISEIVRAKEGSWELVMSNRETIPLSRSQAKKLRKFIKW